MRVLLAGAWRWPMYEAACAEALGCLGVDVVPFKWSEFFRGKIGRYQGAIPVPGPALLKLNLALLKRVCEVRPDVLFVWRGTHVLPSTLDKIKSRTDVKLVSYNNDDPFGPSSHGRVPWHHHYLWRLHLRSLRYYDHVLVYRHVNVPEALDAGAKNAQVLKSYFIPSLHRPIALSGEDRTKYGCDVCFIGHYEPDGRERHLQALVEAGLHVRLYGGGYWTRDILGDLADYFGDVPAVRGDDYAKALCGAKICLAFLSKLNRDTYTRRCFEIPACGRVMLAERTDDLLSMFKEDKEACFFSSTEELVAKAKWLIENPDIAGRIAQAGLRRVWTDGHDINSRAAWLLDTIVGRQHSKNVTVGAGGHAGATGDRPVSRHPSATSTRNS